MSMYGTRGSIVFLNMFERRRRRGRGSGRGGGRGRRAVSWRRGWLLLLPPTFSRGEPAPFLLSPRKICFLTRHTPLLQQNTLAIGMVRAPFCHPQSSFPHPRITDARLYRSIDTFHIEIELDRA